MNGEYPIDYWTDKLGVLINDHLAVEKQYHVYISNYMQVMITEAWIQTIKELGEENC